MKKVKQRQQDRHEQIDVRNRIPGQPAEGVGSRIPLLERGVAVRVLVRDH